MKQPDIHNPKRFMKPVAYGVLSGTAVCILLLLLASLLLGLRDIPKPAIQLISTLIFVISGLAAGYVSSALSRERGLLTGLSCGGCLFILLCLASLAIEGPPMGVAAFSKLASALLASALGGIIGVNKKKKFK